MASAAKVRQMASWCTSGIRFDIMLAELPSDMGSVWARVREKGGGCELCVQCGHYEEECCKTIASLRVCCTALDRAAIWNNWNDERRYSVRVWMGAVRVQERWLTFVCSGAIAAVTLTTPLLR